MGFEGRVKELMNPRAYPAPPVSVELIQTHISYLFLTPAYVYKVKKSVDFGFLDFTTLEKRRHYCTEEVRLNKRLAPDVYLGVVEIKDLGGVISIEGAEGETIEYAVKMRRLALENILEEKIGRGLASVKDIERVAEAIARFHRGAEAGPNISAYGAPEIIEKNINENFTQTEDFVGQFISPASFTAIKDFARRFVDSNRKTLIKRVEGSFIRDCHGDIHSEHISIDGSIEIIDCIEFNERFRYCDTISDMAFLAMDLDFHNRHDLAEAFEQHYLEATRDPADKGLIEFYKSYRAYVRGKVEGLKAAESEVGELEQQEARIRAGRYFDLAEAYTRGAPRPRLIIICGLSGTGKSTLAKALGRALWADSLATDRIRREMAKSVEMAEKAPYGEGRYSLGKREKTYRELIRRACSDYLLKGRTLILDGTFSKNRFLREALNSAHGAGLTPQEIITFECHMDLAALKRRVQNRETKGPAPGLPLSEMRHDILMAHIEEYEKKEGDIIGLDTTAPVQENLLTMMETIVGRKKDRGTEA